MAEKTIVCRFQQPNKDKLERIRQEYRNAQSYLRGDNVELYSATKQQMDRRAGETKDEQNDS